MTDSSLVISVLLVLSGCAYTANVESTEQRLVLLEHDCPSAADVALTRRADEAELASRETVLRAPACWYRVEDFGERPHCDPDRRGAPLTLEEVRARVLSRAPRPNELFDPVGNGVYCTDGGAVLLVLGEDGGCRPTLEGEVASTHVAMLSEAEGADLHPMELLAVDEQAPLLRCTYELERETKRRPFSCSGWPGGL